MSHELNTPEHWNAASVGYSEHVAPVLMECFSGEFVELLDVAETSEALEVGAGSGALTMSLAPRVKSLLVTDFAPSMVAIVKSKLEAGGHTNARTEAMDGMALSLPDASFDRAACCFALMLFPHRDRGFSELRRVLRPGGRAVVSGWTGPDKFESFSLFLRALKAAYPDLPPPPGPLPVFSLADPEVFRAEMEAAGFDNVEVTVPSRLITLAGFPQLWQLMTAGAPPVRALLERVGAEGQARISTELARVVEEQFGSGPIQLSNAATFGTGTVRG